jgi:hypothetical protein
MNLRTPVSHVLVAALALSFLAVAPAAAQWNWRVIPYLWMSDIGMNVKTPLFEGGGDVAFNDLVDKLDGAFQVHLEGRKTRGGVHFDFTYINLGDEVEGTGEGGPIPLPPGSTVKTDIQQLLIEGGGVYQIAGEEDSPLDLIYGVRYIDLDPTVDITLPLPPQPTTTAGQSSSYWDALLGLRWYSKLGSSFDFMARADYAFGETEGTLNLLAGLGYRFGKRDQLALRIGYRHMEVEVVDEPATIDLTMSGPSLGFEIGF